MFDLEHADRLVPAPRRGGDVGEGGDDPLGDERHCGSILLQGLNQLPVQIHYIQFLSFYL